MLTLKVSSSVRAAAAQFRGMEAVLDRRLSPALDRLIVETLDMARERADKMSVFGTNREAIHIESPPAKYQRQIATGTRYGAYVEEGVKGPLAKFPDVSGLFPWVRANLPGAKPEEVDRLTYVIARSIRQKGIRAQPYMEPTRRAMAPRVESVLSAAVDQALTDIAGGEL